MALSEANTFDAQRDALKGVLDYAESTGIALDKFPPRLRDALDNTIELSNESDAVQQLLNEASNAALSASGETAAWAQNMSAVGAEVSAIMASLSQLGGGVVANAGKEAELRALRAGKSIRDARVANTRTTKNAEFDARMQGANWAERQVIGLERFQFERGLDLDSQIAAEREKARERARASSSSGSGSRSSLSEEAKSIERANDAITSRLQNLRDEANAQRLTSEGIFRTAEAAELYTEAMRANGGEIDANTRKMLRQIDVLTSLEEKTRNDPVQRYIDNLPNLADAKRQVQADLLKATEDGLTDALMGDLDPAKILKGIQRSIARGMAQQVMQSIAPGLSTGLGGSVVRGSQTGAALMQQAVAAGGMQAASSIRAASTGAAIPTPGTGSGGGGFLGNMGQMALSVFGFSEGGISNGRSPHPMTMPLSAFANAPRYAEGTPNTSEIPAVLHPNEAVVPLSRGRKIPVEMSGQAQSGPTFNGDFVTQVNVEGGGEGDAELAQRIGGAVRENIESMIDLKIAESAQYGGALNPRGGRF